MAKTPWSFGRSECNRVKSYTIQTSKWEFMQADIALVSENRQGGGGGGGGGGVIREEAFIRIVIYFCLMKCKHLLHSKKLRTFFFSAK